MEEESEVLKAIYDSDVTVSLAERRLKLRLQCGSRSVTLCVLYPTLDAVHPAFSCEPHSLDTVLQSIVRERAAEAPASPIVFAVAEQFKEAVSSQSNSNAPQRKGSKQPAAAEKKQKQRMNVDVTVKQSGGSGSSQGKLQKKQKGKRSAVKRSAPGSASYDVVVDPAADKAICKILNLHLGDDWKQAEQYETVVSATSEKRTIRRLTNVYESLEKMGVSRQHIEQGMSARLGGSTQTVVDYLLLHVPLEELPSSIGGDVEVEGEDDKKKSGKKSAASANKGSGKRGGSVSAGAHDLPDYDFGNWRGKTPKQYLGEWCQKHRCTRPQYNPTKKNKRAPGTFRYAVAFTVESTVKLKQRKKGEKIRIECPDAAKTVQEGQHLAATYALYQLEPLRPIYTLLPPSYGDAWKTWMAAVKASKDAVTKAREEPKKAFISQCLQRLNNSVGNHSKLASALDEQQQQQQQQGTPAAGSSSQRGGKHNNKASRGRNATESGKMQELRKRERKRAAALREAWKERQVRPLYRKMEKQKKKLPVWSKRNDILSALQQSACSIITAETGAGKSTQIPQLILERELSGGRHCQVLCTQPRRISAISIASRVSRELGDERVGGLVGYRVRHDKAVSGETQLTYMTTGLLLRRLISDPLLVGVTHVLVDEVHERSLDTDFLVILLRLQVLAQRDDIKVVLMSATLDAQRFSAYFGGAPVVKVPGRTFPVQSFFLEDCIKLTQYRIDSASDYARLDSEDMWAAASDIHVTGKGGEASAVGAEWRQQRVSTEVAELDAERYPRFVRRSVALMEPSVVNHELIEEVLLYIVEHYAQVAGSVLIFMPSLAEIHYLVEGLQASAVFGDTSKFAVLPLHGSQTPAEQSRVFDSVRAPKRKLIVSTNIAETGVTIDDVVFVIDAGFENVARYDPSTKCATLRQTRISRASVRQRMGRAGRVREGFAWHLYTRHEFEQQMEERPLPEIQRAPLEQLCLRVLDMNVGSPHDFFAMALDPPPASAIDAAMAVLAEAGALADNGKRLSPLGAVLVQLPTAPHIGRTLAYAALFRCVDPIIIMAAAIESKSPFSRPRAAASSADTAHKAFYMPYSDHFCVYKLYKRWKAEGRSRSWARQHFIDHRIMLSIERTAEEYYSLLSNTGFASSRSALNRNSNHPGVLKLVLTAGLYPRVGLFDTSSNNVSIVLKKKKVLIHPSSCTHTNSRPQGQAPPSQWFVYNALTRSAMGTTYIRGVTLVHGVALLLFARHIKPSESSATSITLDKKITLQVRPRTVLLLRALYQHINSLFLQKMENPKGSLNEAAIKELIKILPQQ